MTATDFGTSLLEATDLLLFRNYRKKFTLLESFSARAKVTSWLTEIFSFFAN
jgi:hypothetical protein